MSETKHTPGPWRVMTYSSPEVVSGPDDGYKLVAMPTSLNLDQQVQARGRLADAHLISAAPEMLEALEFAVAIGMVPVTSASEGGAAKFSEQVRVADMIRAAIKKARGEK